MPFLHHPSSIFKYLHITNIHTLEGDENIDMVALDFGFWELLAVESVLLSDGEVDSDFALVEVDVREGSCGGWSGVESKPELAHEHFAVLAGADHLVELLKLCREVIRWENPPVFHYYLERLADADGEIVPWIGIDEADSIYVPQIEGFGQHFSDRERSSFMLGLGIVAGISENSVDLAENEFGAVGRDESGFCSIGKELREDVERADVLGRAVLDTIDKSIELYFADIGEVIVLDDVDSDIEKLEADPKVREPEVRGLYEYDDGTLRESEKLGLDGFCLGVR